MAKKGGRSKYRGVKWDGTQWEAQMWVSGQKQSFGTFDSELAAAEAYDDAVHAHPSGKKRALNFPDRTPGTVSAEAPEAAVVPVTKPVPAATKKKGGRSKYRGVKWNGTQWEATLRVSGERRSFGAFDDEIPAAEAYDDAVRALSDGRKRALNFPDRAPGARSAAPDVAAKVALSSSNGTPVRKMRKGRRASMAATALALKVGRQWKQGSVVDAGAAQQKETTQVESKVDQDISPMQQHDDLETPSLLPTQPVTDGKEDNSDPTSPIDESPIDESSKGSTTVAVEIIVKAPNGPLGLSLACDRHDLTVIVTKLSATGAVTKECKGMVEEGDTIVEVGANRVPAWDAPEDRSAQMTVDEVRSLLERFGCPLQAGEEKELMGSEETISVDAFAEHAHDRVMHVVKAMLIAEGRPLRLLFSRELIIIDDDNDGNDGPIEVTKPKKVKKPVVRMKQNSHVSSRVVASEIVRLDGIGASRAKRDAQIRRDLVEAGLIDVGEEVDADDEDEDEGVVAAGAQAKPASRCGTKLQKRGKKEALRLKYVKLYAQTATQEQRTVNGIKLGAGWLSTNALELMSVTLGEGAADADSFDCRSRRWLYQVVSGSAALCPLADPELPKHGLLASQPPKDAVLPQPLRKGQFVVVARRLTKRVKKFHTSTGETERELTFVQVRAVDNLPVNLGVVAESGLLATAEAAMHAKAKAVTAEVNKEAASEPSDGGVDRLEAPIDEVVLRDNPLRKSPQEGDVDAAVADDDIVIHNNPLVVAASITTTTTTATSTRKVRRRRVSTMKASGDGEASGEDTSASDAESAGTTRKVRRRRASMMKARHGGDGEASSTPTKKKASSSPPASPASKESVTEKQRDAQDSATRVVEAGAEKQQSEDAEGKTNPADRKTDISDTAAATAEDEMLDGLLKDDDEENVVGNWWYATVDPHTGEDLLKFACNDDRDSSAAWEVAPIDAETAALEEAVALAASALAEAEELERTKAEREAIAAAKKLAAKKLAEEEATARALQKKLDDEAALEVAAASAAVEAAAAAAAANAEQEGIEMVEVAAAEAAEEPVPPAIAVGMHVVLESSHKMIDGAEGIVISVTNKTKVHVKLQRTRDGRRVNKLVAVNAKRCTPIEQEKTAHHVDELEV